MKRYLVILLGLIGIIGTAHAESQVVLTPFDVYLSDDDFTVQGPNHNILVLEKGHSATVNIHVRNNDDIPHKITLSSPTDADSSTFSRFEFKPSEILVLPHETNSSAKLHLTVSNKTDTHSTFVTFLGQSDVFGMKGMGFYVVVNEDHVQWTDYSLRVGMPGPAFPHLVTDILEEDAEKLITNGLGTPRYLSPGYQFIGMTDWGEGGSQQFVYSKSSHVSNQTESIQVWQEEDVMSVFYTIDGPNVNNTKSLPFRIAQDESQQITINGLLGTVTEQTTRKVMESDITYKVPAGLNLFDDAQKFSVSINANLPLEEILKVAVSIPQRDSDFGSSESETREELVDRYAEIAEKNTNAMKTRESLQKELDDQLKKSNPNIEMIERLKKEIGGQTEIIQNTASELFLIQAKLSSGLKMDPQLKQKLENARDILHQNQEMIPWTGLGVSTSEQAVTISIDAENPEDYRKIIEELIGRDIPVVIKKGGNPFLADYKIASPLKQIQDGTALFNVKCAEDKIPAYKHDNMHVACVSEETHTKLITRGWALLRFALPDENPSQVLCNRYDGKWHPEYDGCRGNISDLQCSLMGGIFVNDLKICYNDICPENRTYTLCVTNPDLIAEKIGNDIKPEFPNIDLLGPDDRLQIRHGAGYTIAIITLSSWEEYQEWEEGRGPEHDTMLPVPINEDNINPIVLDMLDEMWKFEDYDTSEHDKNLFVKTITKDYGVPNHHGIHDWLKEEHDRVFGESSGGFSSHFEFRDRVYDVRMLAID